MKCRWTWCEIETFVSGMLSSNSVLFTKILRQNLQSVLFMYIIYICIFFYFLYLKSILNTLFSRYIATSQNVPGLCSGPAKYFYLIKEVLYQLIHYATISCCNGRQLEGSADHILHNILISNPNLVCR